MNYKALIRDFNSGKLDKKKIKVVMDNDGGYFRVYAKTGKEEEKISEKLDKKYGLFGGHSDIVNVLNSAGVPCEWC